MHKESIISSGSNSLKRLTLNVTNLHSMHVKSPTSLNLKINKLTKKAISKKKTVPSEIINLENYVLDSYSSIHL